MSERQAADLKDSDGRQIVVTVSKEFRLVKIETEYREIVMSLSEFKAMADWVLERKE